MSLDFVTKILKILEILNQTTRRKRHGVTNTVEKHSSLITNVTSTRRANSFAKNSHCENFLVTSVLYRVALKHWHHFCTP